MDSGLWQYMCQFSSLAAALLSINAALLVLLGFSFLFAELDPGTWAVALLALGVLGVSSTFFLALIVGCRRWRKPPEALAESRRWDDEG